MIFIWISTGVKVLFVLLHQTYMKHTMSNYHVKLQYTVKHYHGRGKVETVRF